MSFDRSCKDTDILDILITGLLKQTRINHGPTEEIDDEELRYLIMGLEYYWKRAGCPDLPEPDMPEIAQNEE